jgi:type IV secretion system protein VirB9
MRKCIGSWVVVWMVLSHASAAWPQAAGDSETADVAKAVAQYAKSGTAPVLYRGEKRKYPFGASTPVLNCAPLRVCTVLLEEGEQVFDVLAGDTARWMQFESRTGPGGQQPLLAFTPVLEPERPCDVTTNVVVTTSRRVYDLVLNVPECGRSERRDENPIREFDSVIEFYYPEQVLRQWKDQRAAEAAAAASAQSREPVRAGSVDELHGGDSFKKGARKRFPWRPVVFDDGERTFLRLPEEAREVPAIFAKGAEDLELVNWRRDPEDEQQLLVEGVHETLVLTLPDGKRPRRLEIFREKSDG